jgi:processive 1,2-diacylglycerol beta-glucosyltransferase
MSAAHNILIISSNTGGGHMSAARALEDSLTRMATPGHVLVKVAQAIEEASALSRVLGEMYNMLLRHRQHWMKYYYGAIEWIKPNESPVLFKLAFDYGMRLLERFCPSVIVSVHPMTQHFFAYLLDKLKLTDKVPLITVVTDPAYGFWRGWACDSVYRYHVGSDDAKSQLIEFGVDPSRVAVTGMPVHRRFRPVLEEERGLLRQSLGLDPDKFTLFINAGWAGGGNIPKLYQALSQSDLDIQAVFLAGRNERLYQDIHGLPAPFPVKVMGYTQEIEHLMQASDLMLSKLGGLTTFEALACQLPILADALTPPMPQELHTGNLIDRMGAGQLIQSPDRLIETVRYLQATPTAVTAMRRAALGLGRPGSADRIAQDVLDCHLTSV